MQQMGAPARDLSGYSEWRDDADPCIMEALDIYGNYLVGQTNGLSDALNLQVVFSVLDRLGLPLDEQLDMTNRLIPIHNAAMAHARKREERKQRARHG